MKTETCQDYCLRNVFYSVLLQTGPVIPMPVPSSFNDITTEKKLRDFVGVVWYDREFYVSSDWQQKRVVLRIDSAHYASVVVCIRLRVL